MDLGRAMGVAVAGASVTSGLVIGARAAYEKLTGLAMKSEQGPVPTSLSKEPGDEEG